MAKLKQDNPALGALKGRGLLQGVEVPEEKLPAALDSAREAGLLVLRSGSNVLRIAPPLVISQAELEEGVRILGGVFKAVL